MDEKFEKTLLYDFYGEMLNEHQRRIYEDIVFNDLSLGEIASEEGISRQGVSDMIKRCGKKLENYEQKLHLVEKFLVTRQKAEQIHELARKCSETGDLKLAEKIEQIASEIITEQYYD